MNHVSKVIPYPDFSIELHFADGLVTHLNMRPFIGDGISAPLADWAYFRQVAVEEGGGITWPNGYDFCPEYLHDFVTQLKSQ
ncbi:MAG: DUF2442 domain-containing protein [Chloroflexi bacterium]|nr:DUF2442 domain-containing protein [Chloroflexota bacterium]